MRIQIQGSALHSAAAWAAKLSPKNPALPILGGVRMVADDELRLSTSDLNTFGEVAAVSTVIEQGEAIVSARLLDQVAKTLRPDGDVMLSTVSRGIEVTCGRARWVLPALSGADMWPAFPDATDVIGEIPAATLSQALARVLPAVNPDSERAEYTGVSMQVRDGALTLVATDTYRLAAAETSWQPVLDPGEDRDLIIPVEPLKIALDAVRGGVDTVKVGSDGNTIAFSSPRYRVIARLIDGKTIRWRSIFDGPEQNAVTTVVVDTDELRRAVAGVSAVASKITDDVIQLDLSDQEIMVSLATDGSEGNDAVAAHHWTGRPLTIGIAHRYLLDALACLGSPKAALILQGEGSKAAMLRPADGDGAVIADGYGHVLMTRKLKTVEAAA